MIRPVLLVIGVLVIVGGVYAFLIYNQRSTTNDQNLTTTSTSATSNIPTDWKTYHNERYGFQFKYPPTWYYSGGIRGDNQYLICLNPNNTSGDCTGLLTVNWNVSFQERYSTMKSLFIKNGSVKESEMFVDGVNGKLLTVSGSGGYTKSVFWEKYYLFNFEMLFGNDILFNQILSTFKFTGTQANTISWKTYHNEKYGFELKYSGDVWVPADIGLQLLSKGQNYEKTISLVKKSALNGKMCSNPENGRLVSCDSIANESIIFVVVDKPIDVVKSMIPSYALTEYDYHTGYKSVCAPLDQVIFIGIKPTTCAFSGFEWNELSEFLFPVGDKTLVVNWKYYDADKNVYLVAEKNFLDVIETLKFTK